MRVVLRGERHGPRSPERLPEPGQDGPEQHVDVVIAVEVPVLRANPRHWRLAAVEAMLGEHLRLTTEEAVARLEGDWAADVAAYDRVHAHALGMADMLSGGLVKQFPRRFR